MRVTDETENSSRWSPLRSIPREILVVVVSILIAFSLDAWWDLSKDRREEGSLLRALVSDFGENLDQLNVIADSETRQRPSRRRKRSLVNGLSPFLHPTS